MSIIVIYDNQCFPIEELRMIGQDIESANLFVPGYKPPNVGLTTPEGIIYSKEIENLSIVVIPDRNIVSRIAKVARIGEPDHRDSTSKSAVKVMAYCKGMDLNFEPSIAYHELAYRLGNEAAHDELAWFRAADNHPTQEWIDLAYGRIKKLSALYPSTSITPTDLAFPLHRWRRNYATVLKIATLELSRNTPIRKSMMLLDWMENDFIIAGPAAMFAQQYFAPNANKKGLLKSLRSPDRGRAIEGLKNAAWDITHLSDFARRVPEGEEHRIRYIFATADRLLGEIAPRILIGSDENFFDEIDSEMNTIWGATRSREISRRLCEILTIPLKHPEGRGRHFDIDAIILDLEDKVTSWQP